MTEQPARRAAEQPRTVEDRVSRMAGEVENAPDPLVALSTRIPKSLHRRVKRTALDVDVEMQQAVADALKLWLARHERDRG